MWIALLGGLAVGADFDDYLLGQYYPPPNVKEPLLQRAAEAVVDFGNATGVIVSPSGHILTNAHVSMNHGTSTTVRRSLTREGLHLRLVFEDLALDLALYIVDSELEDPLPYLRIRTTGPRKGEKVAVIGHPGGEKLSTSFGTVLTPHALVGTVASVEYSAQTWWGSSGSPVVDEQGQMLALHWGWDSEGDYNGRLTGVPMAVATRVSDTLATLAACPDPASMLRIDTQLLAEEGTHDRVRVRLKGPQACLDRIEWVTWHLHPTFEEPDAPGWPGASGFPITLVTWGYFDASASVGLGGIEAEVQGQIIW